ncbi:hypothetical protein N234_00060 [Ralstonia pickettii DTP0602]|nr:hypothetical protein N234_00060 [Ralstonia pickettii DTP0602]
MPATRLDATCRLVAVLYGASERARCTDRREPYQTAPCRPLISSTPSSSSPHWISSRRMRSPRMRGAARSSSHCIDTCVAVVGR